MPSSYLEKYSRYRDIPSINLCVLEYAFLYEFFRILFSMLQQFLWKLCASEENHLLYIFSFLVLFFKSLHVSSCLILMEQKATMESYTLKYSKRNFIMNSSYTETCSQLSCPVCCRLHFHAIFWEASTTIFQRQIYKCLFAIHGFHNFLLQHIL